MRKRFGIMSTLAVALAGASSATASAAPAPYPGGGSNPGSSTSSVQMAYYDDHLDAFATTDSTSKAEAKAKNINYAPGLTGLKPKAFPEIYTVEGTAAQGQLVVFGSEPGEKSYAPLWREVTVTWNPGFTPVLLTSDTQIDDLEAMGQLSETPTSVLLNAPVIAMDVAQGATVDYPTVFSTFYDAHKDGMLATDTSSQAEAAKESINFSTVLAGLDPARFPELYMVRGRHAQGQLLVLGSEPGERDYSPLWHEVAVRWKAGVTPRVIKSDTQIDRLISHGKLVEHELESILNCPVVPLSSS